MKALSQLTDRENDCYLKPNNENTVSVDGGIFGQTERKFLTWFGNLHTSIELFQCMFSFLRCRLKQGLMTT